MKWNPFASRKRDQEILEILDKASEVFSFPAFDNGYIYPASARLSLFRSPVKGVLDEWALVIEQFCYSPRDGQPGIYVSTFASTVNRQIRREAYRGAGAYENYLKNNPHNELRAVGSVDFRAALDPGNEERIGEGAETVLVRGETVAIPRPEEFEKLGIELKHAPRIWVFELCRYLAETRREEVLATDEEQRVNVLPSLTKILQLDNWHHPDGTGGVRPSQTGTFRQLAEVLDTGDVARYRTEETPNSHWSNWPEGGSL